MKIIKTLTLLAAASMWFTACQSDELLDDSDATGVSVTFDVDISASFASAQRTSFSDGSTATRLAYAVYRLNPDGSYDYLSSKSGYYMLNLHSQVTISLPADQQYAVAFWAASKDAPYTFDAPDATLEVNYDDAFANDESRDAFYACKTFTATADATISVTLYRPFVQLDIGTSDIELARTDAKFYPLYSQVSVASYDKFNLITGDITPDATYATRTFKLAQRPQGECFPVEPDVYDYLSMNYILLGEDQEISSVDVELQDANGQSHLLSFDMVPLRRNYRTYIYGQLLTSGSKFNISIVPIFEE